MKGFSPSIVTCIAATTFAPLMHWFRSTDGYYDVLAPLDLASAGGQQLSSKFPLWEFPHFMKPEEVDTVLSLLPDDSGWNNCNRTADEHKTLPGRSCAWLHVGDEPLLHTFLMRVGHIFRADMSNAARLFAVRYRPGSPGVPCHVDKYQDKSINDLSLLVYLTTAMHPDSGLTVFEKAGVSVRPQSGTILAWMSSHINSEHALAPIHLDEPHDRLVLQIGLSRHGTGDSFELPRNSAFGGDYTPDCASWCNVWTCNIWGCLDCPQTVHVCKTLHEGKYCAGWCNNWTSTMSPCLGCSSNQTSTSRLRGKNTTTSIGSDQGLNILHNESNGEP